jgi:hypothetical protein
MQLPVQQPLFPASVSHEVPMPAVTLSGVQVEQSEEMSQPTGQVALQSPLPASVGEQLKERIAATVARDGIQTFMSHILLKLPAAPYTKARRSTSHWRGISLEMQALRAAG